MVAVKSGEGATAIMIHIIPFNSCSCTSHSAC
jgi:hypothetical protein